MTPDVLGAAIGDQQAELRLCASCAIIGEITGASHRIFIAKFRMSSFFPYLSIPSQIFPG